MEMFENGMEIPMAWHGITWQGMTMAWHGNGMTSTGFWDWVW
jgi:hypothetical protein